MNRPLRVEIHLATPIVVPGGIKCLDSLLAWARVEAAMLEGGTPPEVYGHQHEIPVERFVADSGEWVFKASAFSFDWCGETDERHRTKTQRIAAYAESFEAGAIAPTRGKTLSVDTGGGYAKGGLYQFRMRYCRKAVAWCIGDESSILALLSRHVSTFGKLRNKGAGVVREIVVADDEAAHEKWMHRPMPLGSVGEDGYARASHALIAPYWDRKNAVTCLLPV